MRTTMANIFGRPIQPPEYQQIVKARLEDAMRGIDVSRPMDHLSLATPF